MTQSSREAPFKVALDFIWLCFIESGLVYLVPKSLFAAYYTRDAQQEILPPLTIREDDEKIQARLVPDFHEGDDAKIMNWIGMVDW